jgi:hypothetical protein
MVYNTQNQRVSGRCPVSGILSTRKQPFGNRICFRLHAREGTRALLGPLEVADSDF